MDWRKMENTVKVNSLLQDRSLRKLYEIQINIKTEKALIKINRQIGRAKVTAQEDQIFHHKKHVCKSNSPTAINLA